jgi:carboxypeptidase Taq
MSEYDPSTDPASNPSDPAAGGDSGGRPSGEQIDFGFLADFEQPADDKKVGPPADNASPGDDPATEAFVEGTEQSAGTSEVFADEVSLDAPPTVGDESAKPAEPLPDDDWFAEPQKVVAPEPAADWSAAPSASADAEIPLGELSSPATRDASSEPSGDPWSVAPSDASNAPSADPSADPWAVGALGSLAATGASDSSEVTSAPVSPPVAEFIPPTIAEEPLPPAPDTSDPAYPAYEQLVTHVRQTSLYGSIEAALGWDERCMMPASAAEHRAEQVTLLSGLIHERLTDPRLGEWVGQLSTSGLAGDPHGESGTTIRQIKRQYEKRSKLPKALVEELAHTAVMGQHTWQEAREKNDYSLFAPLLEKMVRLKREQADALGYAETRYDALLDEFEQGELTSRVSQVLGALRDELVPLVARVRESGRSPDLEILHRRFPIETQRSFGRAAAEKIGFDFNRGRLDVTAHPFCSGLGPNDCRITTRYDEHHFNGGFFGILHEAGHGIYDQGLRTDQYGLPLGEAVSMGIHESQSRMWEILVGRSLPFWKHFYPAARRAYPEALSGVSLGKFFFAVNDVRSSLIRVEADEFTYNLHILIRFELEQALISGDLQVADLPGAWNEKYKSYLGIDVPSDADGVLQDIHWSAGLFGYFPTYSLGNLYAAQLYETADRELGGLAAQFERGEFGYLRQWLNQKIHRQGQRFTAAELCERITGRALSHEPLITHLRNKYELLYDPAAARIDDLDVDDGVATTATASAGAGFGVAGDEPGFGVAPADTGFSLGGGAGGAVAPRTGVKKRQASTMGTVIIFGGIILGGVLGIALGLWILLAWRGPKGDVLKIRDKLPGWMVPEWKEEEENPAPEGNGNEIDPGEPVTRRIRPGCVPFVRTPSGPDAAPWFTSTFPDDTTIFRV